MYRQLSERARRNYDSLVQELKCRYRTVEQRRTMGAKFSHREQRTTKSVQDFSSDLKLLYDRAHPDRDRQTRMEDLLRRFLDGLNDEEASFHVEYVKEPMDIDEAVNEVINFRETRRRPDAANGKKQRKTSRVVEDESDEERVARLPGRPAKSGNENSQPPSSTPNQSNNSTDVAQLLTTVAELSSEIQQLKRRVGFLEGQQAQQRTRTPRPQAPHTRTPGSGGNQQTIECYKCGQPGHFARGCMNNTTVMGQFQMTTPAEPHPQYSNGAHQQARAEGHVNTPRTSGN